MLSYNIREAREEDINEIVELVLICFSKKFKVIFSSKINKGRLALIEDFKNRKIIEGTFVAVNNGKIIGAFSFFIKELQYDWFSTMQTYIKYFGVYRGMKSIIIGGLLPFNIKNEACFMDYIGVLPEFRGHGVAKKLIKHGEKLLAEKDKKYLFGFVSSLNHASRKLFVELDYTEKKARKSITGRLFFKDPNWIRLEKNINQ